jgi:hypothetical protein
MEGSATNKLPLSNVILDTNFYFLNLNKNYVKKKPSVKESFFFKKKSLLVYRTA